MAAPKPQASVVPQPLPLAPAVAALCPGSLPVIHLAVALLGAVTLPPLPLPLLPALAVPSLLEPLASVLAGLPGLPMRPSGPSGLEPWD